MAEEYDIGFKIVVLGDSGTGKSVLLQTESSPSEHGALEYSQGVGIKVKMLEVDGRIHRVEMWDCPGAERHLRVASRYAAGAAAVVLVFSLADRASFEAVEEWRAEAERAGVSAYVLVGNWADVDRAGREVGRRDAEQYATGHGMSYVETSAAKGFGAGEMIKAAMAAVRGALPEPLDPASLMHTGVHVGPRLARDPAFQASLFTGAIDKATRPAQGGRKGAGKAGKGGRGGQQRS